MYDISELIDIDGIVECLVMLFSMSFIFPARCKRTRTILTAALCFILFYVPNSLVILGDLTGLIPGVLRFCCYSVFMTMAGFLFCLLTRQGQKPQFLVTVMFFKACVLFMSVFYKQMEGYWAELLNNTLVSQFFLYLLGVAMICLSAVICCKMTYPIKGRLSWQYWLISVLTPLLLVMIWYVNSFFTGADQPYEYIIITSLLMLFESFFCYGMFTQLAREMERQKDLELANQSLAFEARQMESTQAMLEQTRAARHELKNNYFYLETLLKEQKYKEMQDFFDRTIWPAFDKTEKVSTGNKTVDIILSQKMMEARQKNIPVTLDVIIPPTLRISSQLLCTLMFNLLDNAIEASEKTDQPDIYCSMKRNKGFLMIEVRNRIRQSVLAANPELKTSKKEKQYHGIGMKIIRQTVERLDGNMEICEKDGFFVVKVMLPDI